MLEVASEKLTERERECLRHFRQARERGVSFAEYCRSGGRAVRLCGVWQIQIRNIKRQESCLPKSTLLTAGCMLTHAFNMALGGSMRASQRRWSKNAGLDSQRQPVRK